MLWVGSTGKRLVQGYAPVAPAGWGLIAVEPWDDVVAPVQSYSTTLTLIVVRVERGDRGG